jgi:ABC-type dipeptide/oligopeptide/nickel transport system ATPase subunit
MRRDIRVNRQGQGEKDMISISGIRLNDAHNKTFLRFPDELVFENNTINFIIGLSGVGKTSLIDFLSAPFTDGPVKNGVIRYSGSVDPVTVINSSSASRKKYINFIKNSVAYIPQKTDSFHPAIPIRKQIYDYYKTILPGGKKSGKKEFTECLKKVSKYAGWDEVIIDPYSKDGLILVDQKEYIDENGKHYCIVDTQKPGPDSNAWGNRVTVYEDKISTGQKQRLLILMGLMQFDRAENPVLLADEFLVNFTYHEADRVLKNIIRFFKEARQQNKTAIFILHDLSFNFLKTLPQSANIKLFAVEKVKNYTPNPKTETEDVQYLKAYRTTLFDFFNNSTDTGKEVFDKFLKSYEPEALKDTAEIDIKEPEGEIASFHLDHSDPVAGIYKNLDFTLKKGRFITITGFSGCGKSTFCNQFLAQKISNKKSFRYLPSQMLSSLSEDSQITVAQDLRLVYRYYNNLDNLHECLSDLTKLFTDLKLIDKNLSPEEQAIVRDTIISKEIFTLSGGQLQRYWFVRLLLDYNLKEGDTEFLVLDESIASLDCITKNMIIGVLLKNVLSRGITVLLISHDLRDINVIYKTLEKALVNNPAITEQVFEQYEMFDQGIYRVKTPFPKYCDNLKNKKANEYIFKNGEIHQLRLHENNGAEEGEK